MLPSPGGVLLLAGHISDENFQAVQRVMHVPGWHSVLSAESLEAVGAGLGSQVPTNFPLAVCKIQLSRHLPANICRCFEQVSGPEPGSTDVAHVALPHSICGSADLQLQCVHQLSTMLNILHKHSGDTGFAVGELSSLHGCRGYAGRAVSGIRPAEQG